MITSDDSLPREQTLALPWLRAWALLEGLVRLAIQSQEALRLAVALPRRLEHEIAGMRQGCETLQDHAHLCRDTNDLCHQRLLVTNHRSDFLKLFV